MPGTLEVPGTLKEQLIMQAGINAAIDGNTVLIQPGTFVENSNFIGKNIVAEYARHFPSAGHILCL